MEPPDTVCAETNVCVFAVASAAYRAARMIEEARVTVSESPARET